MYHVKQAQELNKGKFVIFVYIINGGGQQGSFLISTEIVYYLFYNGIILTRGHPSLCVSTFKCFRIHRYEF